MRKRHNNARVIAQKRDCAQRDKEPSCMSNADLLIGGDMDTVVRTKVTGQELYETKMRMTQFFRAVAGMEDQGTGFPRWNERPSRLIETAWVLWQWRVFIDQPTGQPMPFRQLSELLCEKLHVRMPANIYDVAYRCRQPGHRSIVDYFAMLWREGHTSLASLLFWSEPIRFPRFQSYRGVF